MALRDRDDLLIVRACDLRRDAEEAAKLLDGCCGFFVVVPNNHKMCEDCFWMDKEHKALTQAAEILEEVVA